ncbi:hypothetical protein SNE40_022034 [Patella caerulea]|uniref:Uncharacterized protein n=1 Tax=Patella caerulea TaxID=87958 RepID=A0AAN8G5L1_PATCE
MSFPVLTKDSIKTGSYSRATPKLIEERMSEFVTGLQRTLNHPCVYRVYFLYNELHVVDYVKTHIHVDLDKMSFHLVKNPRSHVGLFDFAYENLQGQIAIYTPADVYLGEGFELIKKDVLAANKLIYIMSRHSRQEKYCDMRRDITSTSCTDKKYFGSHDTYVFVPKGKFPKKVRDYLTVPSQDYGVENMSIWAFRTLGNFTVTNPCKVLKVYHLHCTGLRDAKRRRLNTEKDTGKAWPTDQLGIV